MRLTGAKKGITMDTKWKELLGEKSKMKRWLRTRVSTKYLLMHKLKKLVVVKAPVRFGDSQARYQRFNTNFISKWGVCGM